MDISCNKNILENVICKPSTDRKPIIVYGFNGGYNNCLNYIHHHIKPMIGVVKFDFSDWQLFPTSVKQAKELAQKWSDSIEKRKDFQNKIVIIFFHLELKTIRIQVKEKLIPEITKPNNLEINNLEKNNLEINDFNKN